MIGEPPEKGTQGPSRMWNLDRQVHCSAADPSFAHFVKAGVEPIFLGLFMRHNEMNRACVDACNACADACDHCAVSCLQETNAHTMARCIALDMDCAAFCRLAAGFMARRSEFAAQVCKLCAEICKACGEECAKHTTDHCQACAKACQACAQECEKMKG